MLRYKEYETDMIFISLTKLSMFIRLELLTYVTESVIILHCKCKLIHKRGIFLLKFVELVYCT